MIFEFTPEWRPIPLKLMDLFIVKLCIYLNTKNIKQNYYFIIVKLCNFRFYCPEPFLRYEGVSISSTSSFSELISDNSDISAVLFSFIEVADSSTTSLKRNKLGSVFSFFAFVFFQSYKWNEKNRWACPPSFFIPYFSIPYFFNLCFS